MPDTGEHEEQHGRLVSLPGLIKDQWALGIWSVLGAAVHGKKGREKAYAKIILRHIDAGHTAAPARSLADMWRYGMHQTCTDIIQCIALEGKRPDAAAALVVEFTERQHAADVAAGILAQLVRTDRTPAAVEVLNGLLAAHHYVPAARACVEMARRQESREAAAIVMQVMRQDREDAIRNLGAVVLAQRYATEAAAIAAEVADMGEIPAQGRLIVGLIDSGMLCLACDLQIALVHAHRDDVVASILRETVNMRREDVGARICAELMRTGYCRVVAFAISEMARTGYDYIVSEITFHLAQMTSADVVAKIKIEMARMGNLDLVRDCMIRVSYIGLSWASAAFQIELIRLGEEEIAAKLDSALVEAGHADLVVQEIAVMVQAGFSKEAAMLARKNLLLGNQECVAGVAAGLVEGGCTGLAALVLAELARMENHFVADVIRLVHTSGKQQAAARLAAALVDCGQVAALTDAMIYLASQGDAATVATLELGLVNLGRLTALGQVNNCLMASMHLEEAVKIAAALAERVNISQFLNVLRAAGGQVVPEVWHEVTQAAHALSRAGRAPKKAPDQQQLQEMATYVRTVLGFQDDISSTSSQGVGDQVGVLEGEPGTSGSNGEQRGQKSRQQAAMLFQRAAEKLGSLAVYTQTHQAQSPRELQQQDAQSAQDAGRIPSVELITSDEESE